MVRASSGSRFRIGGANQEQLTVVGRWSRRAGGIRGRGHGVVVPGLLKLRSRHHHRLFLHRPTALSYIVGLGC